MQPDHFAAWHDEDLVRALTLERANYQGSYLASVAAELARRNVDPQAFIDQVEVRYHADASATCTIAQALAKASEELPLWHLLAFTRYFGDTLVVQRELRSSLVNVYRGEGVCLLLLRRRGPVPTRPAAPFPEPSGLEPPRGHNLSAR